MRGQTLIGFALGAILGVAGMWWGHQDEADGPVGNSVPALTDDHGGDSSGAMLAGDGEVVVAQLREDFTAAQARVEKLEAGRRKLATGTDSPSGGATSASPTRTPRATPKAAHRPMPKKLLPLAERLGVQEEPLALAWAIRSGQVEDRAAAVAQLKAFGEQGLLALVALALGPGTGHTMLPPLMGEMAVVGGDEILMRLISEHKEPGGLVTALAHYDTPGARDFLVERLAQTEQKAGHYWMTATALGRLKEPRGGEYFSVEAISKPGWSGVRGHILYALGQMGGAHASRRLSEYLSLPHADFLGTAAQALSKIDPRAAREHARRILDSDRGPFLTYRDRPALEKLAEEE